MVRLSHRQMEQINAAAQAAYPGECCGLLAGRVDAHGAVTVTRVVPSANVGASPGNDRFEVDAQVRFDLMRELSGTIEGIVGHYHSHPDHPAQPSQTDVAMAFEPELVWLITAVAGGAVGDTRAWRLNRDTGNIQDVVLEIDEST